MLLPIVNFFPKISIGAVMVMLLTTLIWALLRMELERAENDETSVTAVVGIGVMVGTGDGTWLTVGTPGVGAGDTVGSLLGAPAAQR